MSFYVSFVIFKMYLMITSLCVYRCSSIFMGKRRLVFKNSLSSGVVLVLCQFNYIILCLALKG